MEAKAPLVIFAEANEDFAEAKAPVVFRGSKQGFRGCKNAGGFFVEANKVFTEAKAPSVIFTDANEDFADAKNSGCVFAEAKARP